LAHIVRYRLDAFKVQRPSSVGRAGCHAVASFIHGKKVVNIVTQEDAGKRGEEARE